MLGPVPGTYTAQTSSVSSAAQQAESQINAQDRRNAQSQRLNETRPQGFDAAKTNDSETRNPYSPFDSAYNASAKRSPVPGNGQRGGQLNLVV
ncbi:MAG: hypothetical protein AB7E85_06950 [Pseudobdellovibrionaceae bacterium]